METKCNSSKKRNENNVYFIKKKLDKGYPFRQRNNEWKKHVA